MLLNTELLREAVDLTIRDRDIPRTQVDEDLLLEGFIAEFVAESESLEGHDSKPTEVMDSVRDLALA